MPVIVPLLSAVNLTPSSTAELSPESTVAGLAKSKMVSAGVTAFDAPDAGPVPTPSVAETVNVYAVPFDIQVSASCVGDPLGSCTCAPAVTPTYGVTVSPVT